MVLPDLHTISHEFTKRKLLSFVLEISRMPTAATKIDASLQEYLMSKCSEEGCNSSEYLRNLIKYDKEKSERGVEMKVDGDKLVIPCGRCGRPISFKLAELGLRRVS